MDYAETLTSNIRPYPFKKRVPASTAKKEARPFKAAGLSLLDLSNISPDGKDKSYIDSEGLLVPSKDTTVRILDQLRPLDLGAPMRDLENIRDDILTKRRLDKQYADISSLHSPVKPRNQWRPAAQDEKREVSIDSIFKRFENPHQMLMKLPYIPY